MSKTIEESGATFKFGTVSASKPGFARVRLPDYDNVRTMWLPLLVGKSQDDKECWTPDVGEQVVVLLDAQGEDGIVLGSVYSDADQPPTDSKDKWLKQFKDGALIEYDRASHTLTIKGGVAKVVIEASAKVEVSSPDITFNGQKVTVNAPESSFSGNLQIGGALTQGAGSGGAATLNGSLAVKGSVEVSGSINASGDIIASGSNSNHHSH